MTGTVEPGNTGRRMAAARLAALVAVALAATARAAVPPSAGDILVTPIPRPVAETTHGYVEYRFTVRNTSSEHTHRVTVALPGHSDYSGGLLGRFADDQLVESIAGAVSGLDVGDISSPLQTPAGYRIFTVTDRVQDTLAVAHILFPIMLSEAGEDEIFRTMDEFEGIALNRGLTEAGNDLGVPVRSDVTLTDGFDFVPGAGSLGVGVDWAVDPLTPLEEVSEFFENGSGYHILEVVSRTEEGTFPFEDVRPQIEETIRARMRSEEALSIAAGRLDEVRAAPSLEAAAESLGWTYGQAGPFLRGQFVQGLGRGTEAVGAAFGASPGTVQGPYDAGDAIVFLRVDERTEADIERFQVMRGQLRAQMESQMSQMSVDRWVQALREEAEIIDLRDRLRAPEQV